MKIRVNRSKLDSKGMTSDKRLISNVPRHSTLLFSRVLCLFFIIFFSIHSHGGGCSRRNARISAMLFLSTSELAFSPESAAFILVGDKFNQQHPRSRL